MNERSRRSRLVPLERALAEGLHACGLEDRLGERRALAAWESIVGREIAAHARAVDLSGGVLTLTADHGAWRQELTLLLPRIKDQFDSRFGAGTVVEIQWARPWTGRRAGDNRD